MAMTRPIWSPATAASCIGTLGKDAGAFSSRLKIGAGWGDYPKYAGGYATVTAICGAPRNDQCRPGHGPRLDRLPSRYLLTQQHGTDRRYDN
ncbi:hypothetical protein F1D05_04270 [Kribbella qitaiheensis]|uniref:Uncharacterized protein n=1 Tax=Kribbella qitaiheensis TaxID=1544730 RepID=A0A7G6WTF9_9ACTN|nr:hypothetical protein [Kribbella qitaiheensis]QNE17274.1 hypothetical protein F1D05_04270 [Kribbella qitaiheensis]